MTSESGPVAPEPWRGDVTAGVTAWVGRASAPPPPPPDPVAEGPAEDPEAVARKILLDQLTGRARSRSELRAKLEKQDLTDVTSLLSFGVAGGLNPALKVGQLVVPSAIHFNGETKATSPELSILIREKLRAGGLEVNEEPIAGTDKLEAGESNMRGEAYKKTGAGSIDMETHIAFDFAARKNMPFAAIRALSDAEGDVLPPAALLPLDENGEVQYSLVASSIFWHPWQIPALRVTNAHINAAMSQLGKAKGELKVLFGE